MDIVARQAVAILAVATVASCQSSIILSPGRTGEPPHSPALGRSLSEADDATCSRIRKDLITFVAAMAQSLNRAHEFWATYNDDIQSLRDFDSDWRDRHLAIKGQLFGMATCNGFKTQWTSALAIWRDVFRYEKENVSRLSLSTTPHEGLYDANWIEERLGELLAELEQ